MKLKHLPLFLLITVLSCNTRSKDEPDTQHIDSMLTEIDTINTQLKQLDIEFVLQVYDSIDHAENINKIKELRAEQNHMRMILEWYDEVYREVMFGRNHLESLKKEFEDEDKADTVINNKLNHENIILSDLESRCNQEIRELKERIADIKRQFNKNE